MHFKYNTLITSLFATLVVWTIFGAVPYFALLGPFPQVDTQIIYLNFLCGLMYFYFAVRVLLGKYKIEFLHHPLISLSFLLALISLISSAFSGNFTNSISGSPQIGQGVFWYLNLAIMLIIFSQVTSIKKIRFIFFINIFLVTIIISLFTFFPYWKGLPISFYFFTDYLCFYGVLTFILLTTVTKNFYIHLLGFLILGWYFLFLENRAAIVFFITTALAALIYFSFKLLKKNNFMVKVRSVLFSDIMFAFIIVLISFLILGSSLYFWSDNYSIPWHIKGSFLDAPIVRGKLFEISLYSLNNFKSLMIGNGWGGVTDLLLANMNTWQYDELRAGYNLHFHTHNEIAEHLSSVGLIGGFLFVIYMYYAFKFSGKFSFSSKLAWLLFFKINCFWFMWIGTFAAYAVVISCFILYNDNTFNAKKNYFKHTLIFFHNKSVISLLSICLGCFVLYGSYLTYHITKINSYLNYSNISAYVDGKKDKSYKECLSFYNEIPRGGLILERFLHGYSAHLMTIDKKKIAIKDIRLLEELKCKADQLIESKRFTISLLATAFQVDTDYFYKFNDLIGYNNSEIDIYNSWLFKANAIAEFMPRRGDLLLPFLSYAVNNNKSNDALNICKKNIERLESFCLLIKANHILTTHNLDKNGLKNSINLIKKSIEKGIFSELVYGFWLKQCDDSSNMNFCNHGNRGVPLSPNIIFLIGEKEKLELEKFVSSL